MSHKPTVSSFVGTFLKPEMWHVYHQVSGLKKFRSVVMTRERSNPETFPHDEVFVLPEARSQWWNRAWLKYVLRKPQVIYKGTGRVVLQALDQVHTDLLHIYFGHEATRLAPIFEHCKKPMVVSFHGADLGAYVRRPGDIVWLPEVFDKAKLILARCESFIPILKELGCPPEKLRLNRTSVPWQFFARQERKWPEDGAWGLVQACRLTAKKGVLTALRAFAQFVKKYPNATFTIAGDGPQLGEIQREVWRLGLTRKVFFVGFLDREALRRLFYQSHFFLHPSEANNLNDIEGIPNSLLEAMATGLVCFSTPHAGIPEAVENEKDGYLLPEKNADALAEKLLALAQDETTYRRVSQAATEKIKTIFAPELQINILEEIYQEALKG
ncbi:MAG: glycosyltransferase [Verrucomicrobiae bacterium]|nr:glycosyltransferase [Verrucomicrobiae bacterium]